MSEVVPLPSFGEVFFDARGQDRVLRVTWHEGTLVLSLWRGEMCTASFRMPMDDVGRLVDTLDVEFAEAGGQYAGGGEYAQDGDYAQGGPGGQGGQHAEVTQLPRIEPAEYPGTGQYARPAQVPDSPAYDSGYPAHEATPAYGQPAPAVAALGPNDVLVARGTPPTDRLVASHSDSVPRENMIVGGALPLDPQSTGPYVPQASGPFDLPAPGSYDPPVTGSYELPAPIPHESHAPGSYGPSASGSYGPPTPVPYESQPTGRYDQPAAGSYGPPTPVPYESQPTTGSYGPSTPIPYESQPTGRYDQPAAGSYGPSTPIPYESQPTGRYDAPSPPASGSYDPVGEPVYQFPSPVPGRPAYRFDPVPAEPAYPPAQRQPAAPQQQPAAVDPNDPLGLGPVPPRQEERQNEPSLSRPYVQDQMYATGERLRPEHGDDQREW